MTLDWRKEYAPEIIGKNPLLADVLNVAERVAQTDCTVLVTGESGTGKELLARAIHRASGRGKGCFVPLNCGAVPESLLESELFGHVRGAFTGAVAARTGRFALAEGGTIFLDEIGEMSVHLQAKLLRVLQEKEFSPVGDSRTYPCDVRVLAATNCDLEQMVEDGSFRADLYWRLNVVPLELPALKLRGDDIEELALFFVDRYNSKYDRALTGITPEALEMMRQYSWPGNVRQLENTIQRVVVVKGEGALEPCDLPPRLRSLRPAPLAGGMVPARLPHEGLDLRDVLEQMENSLILQALERTAWNKNQAASLLQLNRTTLVEKLKKKGFSSGQGSSGAAA
jgi:transcriptional regulator with PAS, ATPase and Fis domain